MIASHTSQPLMALRGTGAACACVEWLEVVPPKSPVPAPPASPNLSGRCIGDPAVCTASDFSTIPDSTMVVFKHLSAGFVEFDKIGFELVLNTHETDYSGMGPISDQQGSSFILKHKVRS